jgi:ATP-dependent DNA ligase
MARATNSGPLSDRKRRLRAVMPRIHTRLLFLDRGRDLFRVACKRDVEDIVGKWAHGTYQADARCTSWVKIKNLRKERTSNPQRRLETAKR